MDLGLNALTDDQIVELARSIAAEVATRNPAVADAAQQAIRDEIARIAQSQDTKWAGKKWLALMVQTHVCRGAELAVWRSQDGLITRVYIDKPSAARGKSLKWCYHVTGDSRHPPRTLSTEHGSKSSDDTDHQIIALICQHAAAAYRTARIDCAAAAALDYATPPEPADVRDRAAALAAEKARAEARKSYRQERWNHHFAAYNSARQSAMEQHDVKYASHLPQDVQDSLDALLRAANAALDADMISHDTEHPQ